MASASPERLTIEIDGAANVKSVSALAQSPADPFACFVFAHGAGAGMDHAFMAQVAERFCDQGVATLRFQFPYMESGSKRPDRPPVAHAAIRAAVACAAAIRPTLALFAGGKSFGGRMTSQAQALAPLPEVRGLVFLGFPLHLPDKPSSERAAHLTDIDIPLLIIQGTRDAMAEIGRMRALAADLGTTARLIEVAEADHGFHVPKRSGRTDEEVQNEIVSAAAAWMRSIVEDRA